MKDNRSRELMMKEIREALKNRDNSVADDTSTPSQDTFINADGEDISVLFAQNFTQNGGTMFYCYNENDIRDRILEIQKQHDNAVIGCASENLASFLGHLNIGNCDLCDLSKRYTIGATLCESLLAWRGGIVISSNQGLATTIPSLFETTIVLAFTSQVVADWEAAFERLKTIYSDLPNNMIVTTPATYAFRKGHQKLYLILIEDETT